MENVLTLIVLTAGFFILGLAVQHSFNPPRSCNQLRIGDKVEYTGTGSLRDRNCKSIKISGLQATYDGNKAFVFLDGCLQGFNGDVVIVDQRDIRLEE